MIRQKGNTLFFKRVVAADKRVALLTPLKGGVHFLIGFCVHLFNMDRRTAQPEGFRDIRHGSVWQEDGMWWIQSGKQGRRVKGERTLECRACPQCYTKPFGLRFTPSGFMARRRDVCGKKGKEAVFDLHRLPRQKEAYQETSGMQGRPRRVEGTAGFVQPVFARVHHGRQRRDRPHRRDQKEM